MNHLPLNKLPFFNVWTYKWSCGLDNSLSFQRRCNVMIHPNTWINVNNFLFDWTQFVVRIIHGFLVTLQFGHIFGVLLDRSALFTFLLSWILLLTLNSSPRQSALKRGTSNWSTFTAKYKSFLMVIDRFFWLNCSIWNAKNL